MDDPYTILGVDKTASKETIKRTYRKKAKEMHPDNGGDKDEFVQLSRAYQLLLSDSKRAYYDRTGEEKVDTEETMLNIAVSTLCSTFMGVLQEGGPYVDAVRKVTDQLYRGESVLRDNIRVLQKDINMLQLVKKKLVYKGNHHKGNFLLLALDEKIRSFNAQMEDAKFQIDTIAIAKKLLKDFKYNNDSDMNFGRTTKLLFNLEY